MRVNFVISSLFYFSGCLQTDYRLSEKLCLYQFTLLNAIYFTYYSLLGFKNSQPDLKKGDRLNAGMFLVCFFAFFLMSMSPSISFKHTGCLKRGARRLNGYCEGAINRIDTLFKILDRSDFKLEFGIEYE